MVFSPKNLGRCSFITIVRLKGKKKITICIIPFKKYFIQNSLFSFELR